MNLTHDGAIYLRLSKDDGRDRKESESILSQRILLRQYAASHGIRIVSEFADDGISGMQWNRPAFQEMLRAAEHGWIHTVLVKDLSRLSRDYIRIGELLEYWFPAHGIRLIAVSDGVDTGEDAITNEFSPVRALMNDWYTRDISRKVRAAISARQQAGLCTLATVPYGYRRDGKSLAPIPQEAEVVKRIFRLYTAGNSFSAIASELTDDRIPAPRKSEKGWSDATVRRILMNPVYAGSLMLHTTEKIGYKCSKTRRRTPEEAIRFDVPAVITRQEFDNAQRIRHRREHKKQPKHWLSGQVFCGECGCRMTVCGTPDRRLICTGRRNGNGCRNPSMQICTLETGILSELRRCHLPVSPAALPYLVESVRMTEHTAEIHLRCRAPEQTADAACPPAEEPPFITEPEKEKTGFSEKNHVSSCHFQGNML